MLNIRPGASRPAERTSGGALVKRLVIGALAISLLALPGLSGSASAQTPKRGGSLTYLFAGQTPPNWDPISPSVPGMEANTSPAMYLEAVYGVLAYEDYSSGKVVMSMARSITSTSPSEWTLNLRPGIKFSDGTAYDAAAVKFNWERHQTHPNSPQYLHSRTIKSMQVVNPTTLRISLVAPNGQFDRLVARQLPFIGSPKAMADKGAFQKAPVGAGPFLLKSYVANTTATYVRNPKYWDSPRPYIDQLVIRQVADNQQRYNTMKAGQADAMQIFNGYGLVSQARSDGFKLVTTQPGGGGTVYILNQTRPPFNDPVARRALQAALNVGGFSNAVDSNVTKPMKNLFNPGSAYYDKAMTIKGYNRQEAQLLLDEYARKAGHPLRFEIYGHPGSIPQSSYYQAQLKEFDNIDAKIKTVAVAQYVAGLIQGQFDIANYPYSFGDPIGETSAIFGSKGTKNFAKYSNADVDRLLAQAGAVGTQAERVKLFSQVQRRLIDDVAAVWERTRPDIQANDKSVQGMTYAIDGVPLWDRVWFNK